MNKHTLQFVRGPSSSIESQLSSLIAAVGNSGILNAYAQGTVVSIDESIVTLNNVILYSIDENILLANGNIILKLNELKVFISNSLASIYDIKIGSPTILLVHLKQSGYNPTVTGGGFSRYPEYVGLVVNTVNKIEELIQSTSENEDILSLHAKLKHYVAKSKYSTGLIIPTETTRDSLNELLQNAQNRISMLLEAYPNRFKSVPIDISSIQTERGGLKQFLIDCLKNNQEPLVIMKAKLINIVEATNKMRLVFNDCDIRAYDHNCSYNNSVIIDHLSHINCYVDQKFIDSNNLIDYLPTYGREHNYIYLLGKASSYLRNSYRASQSESSIADIGISLMNYSPVPALVTEVIGLLPQWEELLLKKEILAGTADLTKKIIKRIDKIVSYDRSFINTNEITFDILNETIADLNLRFDACMAKRAELVSKQQEEEAQAKLMAGLQLPEELTEEAIAYFKIPQLI